MNAEVAVMGGSGFYIFDYLKDVEKKVVSTPYGESPEIAIGKLGDIGVAFLPRHGPEHTLPPHLINYRANLWALKELGAKRVLAVTTAGSLNPRIRPNDLVSLDQFVDFTRRRHMTFYEGGKGGVVHIDVTEPYCPELRRVLIETAQNLKLRIHPRGVYACSEGPRFETASEIKVFRRLGCDVVGMTNVPECTLARELELCYTAIAVVTNFATGISKTRLTHDEVAESVSKNIGKIKNLIFEAIPRIPLTRECNCGKALSGAVVKLK